MINKLRFRFVALAMAALLTVLSVCVAAMNALNYYTIVQDADTVLTFLSRNKGDFPDLDPNMPGDRGFPGHMSPETPYETRYFSVLMDADGDVLRADTGRISSVTSEQAEEYAREVFLSGKASGFADDFRYLSSVEGRLTRVTFLDCGRKLDSFRTYLRISVGITLAGLAVMFLVIVFFSGRIVRPMAESFEKQKRFITDAGHEIKTPLTIISANTDLLEADPSDSDCLRDIRRQTQRLAALTEDMVRLARMEEAEKPLEMTDTAVSEVIEETASAFRAVAETQGKSFTTRIQPDLFMEGNDAELRRLVGILADNALKYSPRGGTVEIVFSRVKRTLQLDVFNTTEAEIDPADLEHVFDRFYRMDKSRNSSTGGHGLGLSIAKAITEAHGGKIRAWTSGGRSFGISCVFPI